MGSKEVPAKELLVDTIELRIIPISAKKPRITLRMPHPKSLEEALYSRRVSSSLRGDEGETLLHYAARNCRADIYSLLIRLGTNVD